MRKKTVVYTKRCSDGRACAPINYEEFKKLGKRAQAAEVKAGWSTFRLMDQTAFIPDEYETCNACLAAKYNLDASYDHCDQLGMEPRHFDEDAVLAALRRAEGRQQ